MPLHATKTNAALAAGERTVRIIGFGDSITGIYYHTGGRRAWPEMLGLALQRIYPQAKVETITRASAAATPRARWRALTGCHRPQARPRRRHVRDE